MVPFGVSASPFFPKNVEGVNHVLDSYVMSEFDSPWKINADLAVSLPN